MGKRLNVFILAAGRGLRMGKLGKEIPKSLANINNSTILSKILQRLDKIKKKKKYFFVLGYKYKKILGELKNNKVKFNYTLNKNYSKTGSAYSWYLLRKYLPKNKNDTILIHADIYFHYSHLDKIFSSKKENIIGSVKKLKKNTKRKGWVLDASKDLQITRLRQKKNYLGYYGEISCINRFSYKSMKKIFNFMNYYFLKNGKDFTWEILLNDIVRNKILKIYTNKNYKKKNFWFNINKPDDLIKVRTFVKTIR